MARLDTVTRVEQARRLRYGIFRIREWLNAANHRILFFFFFWPGIGGVVRGWGGTGGAAAIEGGTKA